MFAFAIAAASFAAEPSPVAAAPFQPQPRFVQVGTVPGFAPPPLAAPPVILNVTVNPPVPGASYTVTAVYSSTSNLWVGTLPNGVVSPVGNGGKIGVVPYSPSVLFSRTPFTADQLSCRIIFLAGNGGADYGGGFIRMVSDAPFTAGPLPWILSSVTAGYSFTVAP